METTSDEMQEWLKSSDSREYFELVAFPTVAADPARLRDCVACATWLKKWLKGIGAEAELVLPPQRGVSEEKAAALSVPVVFAELKGTEGAPTLLFYGHYDVQPADPLEQWKTPPFEPTPRDGRVYARGAQDDKGQFFAFLCGLREFWREAGADGRARPNVKILLEGQEESGSTGLFRLLGEPEFRRRIAADVMLVCDTSAASDLRPAIVAGMRGVCHFTVRLEAASRDLHSGEFGGVAPNAAQGMCELLASLHDARGAIAVAGFRDGAVEPTAEELEAATAGAASEAEIAREIGTDPCGGERGVEPVRRGGFDPTIEVNGVHSGYGGPRLEDGDSVRGGGEAFDAAGAGAESAALLRARQGAPACALPGRDAHLVPRGQRSFVGAQAAARLAGDAPGGGCALGDGCARAGVPLGRCVHPGRRGAQGDERGGADPGRLGAVRRPHPLAERVVLRATVPFGEEVGR